MDLPTTGSVTTPQTVFQPTWDFGIDPNDVTIFEGFVADRLWRSTSERATFLVVENFSPLTLNVELPGGVGRLRELALYVCKRCEQAERFGKVKLNKILWRADFEAYRARRIPVTGRQYVKLAAGPAPSEMFDLLGQMEHEGAIRFRVTSYPGGYDEERPCVRVEPDLSIFNEGDLFYTDAAIKYYWAKSATDASLLSHKVAWKSTGFMEPIAYDKVFLSDRLLSDSTKSRFVAMAKKQGWKSI